MNKELLEEIKEPFADLEKVRIEILQEKIQTGLNEFKDNPKQQWTELRFEKTLLETLLESLKQAERVSKQEARINNLTFDLAVSRAQNKRYQELLNKVAYEDIDFKQTVNMVREFLEGEE